MSMFAVFESWGWNTLPIARTTAKKTIAMDRGRERHLLTSEVRCVLPEARALRLVEKLKSSAALAQQERGDADRRHRDRVDALCIAATEELVQ